MSKKPRKKALPQKGKRGGARPGAGRKPKPLELKKGEKSNERPKTPARADKAALVQTEQTNLARKFGRLAISTLADVAKNGISENARNHAAEKLLEWGYGKPLGISGETLRPNEPKSKPLGKKQEAIQAAANPDQGTDMGKLMAERAAQAKLNS